MKKIVFNNGVEMPLIIQTTNWMDYQTMKRLVKAGLKIGYRAFDTARDYGNEDIVGKVLKECLKELGLQREDIFITTKIGNGQQAEGNIDEQINISLKNLQTDYVDLWMMHWPFPNHYVKTWHKMEKVYQSGKVRSIGMANYQIRHFEHLFHDGVDINPHCVQMELHPLHTAKETVKYLKDRDIAIQAYSPLCRMIPKIRDNQSLKDLAAMKGQTVGQIVLRWHIQNQTAPVFKSLKTSRLEENYGCFGFSLTNEEMNLISSLNEDFKYHLESASCPGY